MNFFNYFRSPKPKTPPHVHSWRPIAANHGELGGTFDVVGHPVRVTEILRLCDCGDYDRTFVQGTWTLEQVQAGEMSKDVIEMRKMAGL